MQAMCQRQVAQFRGASRPIAADIGFRAPFAGAEAVPGLRSHGPLLSPLVAIYSHFCYIIILVKLF